MTMGYLIGTLVCMSALEDLYVLFEYLVVFCILLAYHGHSMGIYGNIWAHYGIL